MPKAPRRPDPPPLETNDRPVILVGMGAWVVTFVVLVVFFRDDLRDHHATYWLWACGIGVAMGLYGLHFTRKQRRRSRRWLKGGGWGGGRDGGSS